MPIRTYWMPIRTYWMPIRTYWMPIRTYWMPIRTYWMPIRTYRMPIRTYWRHAALVHAHPQVPTYLHKLWSKLNAESGRLQLTTVLACWAVDECLRYALAIALRPPQTEATYLVMLDCRSLQHKARHKYTDQRGTHQHTGKHTGVSALTGKVSERHHNTIGTGVHYYAQIQLDMAWESGWTNWRVERLHICEWQQHQMHAQESNAYAWGTYYPLLPCPTLPYS